MIQIVNKLKCYSIYAFSCNCDDLNWSVDKLAMSDFKAVGIAPLNENNFMTWKIQIKMILLREELWDIVEGKEVAPEEKHTDFKMFSSRRNKA